MPEVNQIDFSLREITELMVKKAGKTEGLWSLGFHFNINVMNLGPTQTEAKPGVVAIVTHANITRVSADEGEMKESDVIVDAAKLD